MSRDRGDRSPRTLRSANRFALAAAAVTALSMTASGCVVVHGEREFVPTTTRADAARALKGFLAAYNKADKANDRSLDADRVTGALGDIDAGKLKAGHATNPGGNPGHVPLELTDAKFMIPRKAGWPRWFVADTRANKGSPDTRWLLVFTRSDASKVWAVSYLTIVAGSDVPTFKKDKDGWAEPVSADDPALAVQPSKLGTAYATYLRSGGNTFAPGPHTSQWRATRLKNASKPGVARQYIDESLTNGDYAPVGLRTTDGGALLFFATHHYEKQTAARDVNLTISDPNTKALLTGEVKQSVTLEYVSNQAVLDPPKGQVKFLSRVEGLTGAKGA
jgi:hypothetical protein